MSKLIVSVSGCLIPLALSTALLIMTPMTYADFIRLFIMVSFLTIVYNRLTKIIRGLGIGIPLFTAFLITVTVGSLMSKYGGFEEKAAIYTYFASTIAALIGIDIINLRDLGIFRARKIVIGGMGYLDALVIIPTFSALLLDRLVPIFI